jgi:hypothetical protein
MPNKVDVSLSIPDGVICLLSALAFYELTTFNPTFISVALPRGTWKPKIEYPPVECDCFRYRNKIGLDIAREGLIEYLKKKERSLEKLLQYAEICRVKSLIQSWLNALI